MGRPVGVRNRPVLMHGLPETDNPAAWLLALMRCEIAPMRLRLSAAKWNRIPDTRCTCRHEQAAPSKATNFPRADDMRTLKRLNPQMHKLVAQLIHQKHQVLMAQETAELRAVVLEMLNC